MKISITRSRSFAISGRPHISAHPDREYGLTYWFNVAVAGCGTDKHKIDEASHLPHLVQRSD